LQKDDMANEVILKQPNRRQDDDDHPMLALKKELEARKQSRDRIEQLTREFTAHLFDALERDIRTSTAEGIPGFGKPRRIPHPAGDWRQALQIYIEDWSVIFVPLLGLAWPNPRDEARIHSSKFKEPCGRIAAFWADEPNETSFYDFLIFSDGSWFAWGYGWPRTQDNVESTDFDTMVFEMLTSFVKDIHTTWRPRSETTLSQSLDAKRRAYRFGRPGEE
jgi:hypothetical protein